MEQAFSGFSPQTAEFFLGLAVNNSKEYYRAHKAGFDRHVIQPLTALARDLEPLLQKIDPGFETRPVQGKAIARLRRDTRFTKDKTPFRTNLWLGYRRPSEENSRCLGFFFDVSAFNVSWGMGMYAPYRPLMEEVRGRILQKPREFAALVGREAFTGRFALEGEAYRRPVLREGRPEVLDWGNRKYVAAIHAQPLDASAFSADLAQAVWADFLLLAPLYRLFRGMAPIRIEETDEPYILPRYKEEST